MSCLIDACPRPQRCRGYCDRHYRRRLHTGRYGYRDAAAARVHISRLRELGWTWQAIGDTAGIAPWTPHNLHRGTTRRLLAESEAALLAVPLVRRESHRGVSAVGARRRVQALARIGWPCWQIEDHVGCARRTLTRELSRGRISTRLAHRIARVYTELARTPGPSRAAAGKARQHDFQPPWAWIPETIDDPQAQPLTILARAS